MFVRLYLHSALVQSRKLEKDERSNRRAIRFNTIDSTVALTIAFFVNAAIMVLAMQLPLAMFPLLLFTCSRKRMGTGKLGWFLVLAGWGSALLITAGNHKTTS